MEFRNSVQEFRENWSAYSGIELPDSRYSIFYDETGNVRKFRVSDNGVNAPSGIDNDFILGGVLYKGNDIPCNPDELFEKLRFSAGEMKIKTLAGQGTDFWGTISKDKISTFLLWLETSGLYIHYSTLNNIFYSVVDIIDSILVEQTEINFGLDWIGQLKVALHRFVRNHIKETMRIFAKYDYPNLKKENIQLFCFDFCSLIEESDTSDDFFLECVREMLKTNGKRTEMVFLQNNTDRLLVADYSQLRISRCILYNNSKHYFDQEPEAAKSLGDMQWYDNGKRLDNFSFLDSKDNKLIQISDVWIGILGKMFNMIDNSDERTILTKMQNTTANGRDSIRIINSLIDKSEALHKALILNVNDVASVNRRGRLMELMSQHCTV